MNREHNLAAIMFSDIVGYSRLMGENESLALDLLQQNRELQKPIIEKYHGTWIKELGDGVMSQFKSATDAVNAALEIQQAITKSDKLKIRIGIHLGDVVLENGDVFGDGVNIASRIEALAQPGEIWVSESIKKSIQNKEGIYLITLGKKTLKNIKDPVEVFKVQITPGPGSQPLINRKRVLTIIAILILVCGMVYLMNSDLFNNSNTVVEKSIAVMPFDNLSQDPEQAYFADGITEELLTQLAQLQDLRVISRTSSMRYRNSDKSIPEIASELNVNYVVEGSVRKSGNRVRITAQLIRAGSDDHLWAESFDRELDDIFGIQSEVSGRIASELKISVSPEENSRLMRIPTENLDAYELYLQGRQLLPDRTEGNLNRAKSLFEEAVKLDSMFADAWAELGNTYWLLWGWATNDSIQYKDMAIELSEKALSMNPNLARPYSVIGAVYSEGGLEVGKGLDYLIKALRKNPGDQTTLHRICHLFVCSQFSQEAVIIGEEVVNLDPFSLINNFRHIQALTCAGYYERAWEQIEVFTKIFPDQTDRILLLKRDYYYATDQCESMLDLSDINYYLVARCYAIRGDSAKTVEYLDSTTNVPPEYKGYVLNRAVGRYEKIINFMADNLNGEVDIWENTDPFFAPLDTIPAYQEILPLNAHSQMTRKQVDEIMALIRP